jgi:hypothetical protein
VTVGISNVLKSSRTPSESGDSLEDAPVILLLVRKNLREILPQHEYKVYPSSSAFNLRRLPQKFCTDVG